MAVTAFVYLLPAQADVSTADSTGSYEVSGDMTGTYEDLVLAINAINANAGGMNYTITSGSDDTRTTSFTLNSGKNVRLISSEGNVFKITMITSGRHGNVNGSLTLENIILDGNGNGGGIRVNSGGSLTMDAGAVIQNCYLPTYGMGAAVFTQGTLTMNDGSVIRSSVSCYGGGVYVSGGVLNMNSGSTISGNTATDNGGGVYVRNGTFNMTGGTISNNKATDTCGSGAGVYSDSSTFTMVSGKISGNEASWWGGGVYSYKAVFNMGGDAVISGNKAIITGGGVYSYQGATFNMNGHALITGNTSGDGAGGVYNKGDSLASYFTMSGDAVISNNTAGEVGGGVLNEYNAVFTMASGEISGNIAKNSKSHEYYHGGGGVYNYSYAVFNMTGGSITKNTAGENGGGVLNTEGSTFTMSGDAVISHNKANGSSQYYHGGGGVYSCSTFTMQGGSIFGNNSVKGGGGVSNYRSSFTMDGGSIFGNTAGTDGGGVYNFWDGTVTMSGNAVISDNSASVGGGVYNYYNTSFTMNGNPKVSGNTATDLGGGIYSNLGKLTINGGTISNNTAEGTSPIGSGGGIFTASFADLSVADGVVLSDNYAPTIRTKDISPNADIDGDGVYDVIDYAEHIGNAVLDDVVRIGINASAYNNHDINYIGDSYIVFIDIDPDGIGTVTVADGKDGTKYGTLTDDGYIYVPSTITSITFSAVPVSGYELKRFVIDEVPEIGSSPMVSISGDMYVIAEFILAQTSPPTEGDSSKDYTITATSDSGSTISPGGTVKVHYGDSKAFIFSSRPGYTLSAVYVDGKAISVKELASGMYTFTDVNANHTISVVSKAGGVGGGGDTGNPGGGDTGNPGGGDIGSSGGGGEPGAGPSYSGEGNGRWAILNLVCAIVAVLAGIIAVIEGRDRIRKDDGEDGMKKNYEAEWRERSNAALLFRVLALIVGIVSVIVFFLTEDWTLPVSITDKWTVLMVILLLVTLAVAAFSFRFDEGPEDKTQDANAVNE